MIELRVVLRWWMRKATSVASEFWWNWTRAWRRAEAMAHSSGSVRLDEKRNSNASYINSN